MGKDIRRGTVEQLWTNVEAAGRGHCTIAHFELNSIAARMSLHGVSSETNDPLPAPFAEGEQIITLGKMHGNTFHVKMAYLPERDQEIDIEDDWLVARILSLTSIAIGLFFLNKVIKFHGSLEFWLAGLAPIALGIYFIVAGLDERKSVMALRATAKSQN